jgi:hypothetical protein
MSYNIFHKAISLSFLLCTLFFINTSSAQEKKASKIGWFISPEIGGIFHGDHLGLTVGASLGIKLFNDHLKLGIQGYGRPGPINAQEFFIEASDGQTYKGNSTLRLRADHGFFGLFLAPSFSIKKIQLDFPVTVGMLGGGFYFTGDDRKTPDGDRVSVWENKLMDGRDAGFGLGVDIGARVFFPLKNEHISLGAGLHYTIAPTWETYYDPTGNFYNNRLRFSLVVLFESK